MIRHRHDYGAILLLDERFAQEQQKQGMSLWLRPHIQVWSNYREGSAKVQEFFRRASGGRSGSGQGEGGGTEARGRVGAGARAPRSLVLEAEGSLREAVVVGAELEEDADYVDPKAIKRVVRQDEPMSAADIEKYNEFRAAIKKTQQEQEEKDRKSGGGGGGLRRAGTMPEEAQKRPSLSAALMRSSSTGTSVSGGGGGSSGKKKRRLSGLARAYGEMPSSQTLSQKAGISSQTFSQRVIADQASAVGSKRQRPLGLQGSIGKGRSSPMPLNGIHAAV